MKTRELLFFGTILMFSLFSGILIAQQSTTGPIPPEGTYGGKVDNVSDAQVIVSGVPSYIWYRGCGPTALGMVIGYYDGQGYSDLIDGDASTQTTNVDNAITNNDHYNDYSLPIDYYPNLLADLSELGGAHTSNCIGDFMQTSWSSENNYWGWSWSSDVGTAFSSYINMQNSSYVTSSSYEYYSDVTSWNLYINEIDNDRPVVLLVDSDGDGGSDHFVAGIGYDDATDEYAVYDTWDHSIHWYEWRGVSSGDLWGVWGFNMLELEPLDPPHITVIPDNYDFGYVETSSSSTHTFELTNDGGSVAEGYIPFDTPSLQFFVTAGAGNFSIEPGESHYFDITFYPVENVGYSTTVFIDGYGECNDATVDVSGWGIIYLDVSTEPFPPEAGSTTGDGTYIAGEECCLNAISNPGYVFDNWEEYPWSGSGTIFTPEYCYSTVWWHGDYNWRANFFPFNFQLKVNLSGCFNGVDMNPYPDPESIPLNQPYNTSPWNYEGDENVAFMPNPDIVDWILIELRHPPGDASTATVDTRIARQAAFLLKDGSVVGMDGYSNLSFDVDASDNFHVVIWHRNHLGIVSADPLVGTTIMYQHIYSYDFTSNSNKAFGGVLAQKEVASGIWGMIGADGDANGIIAIPDKEIWSLQAGEDGYQTVDYNLNGQIENLDKNDIWEQNMGESSQIPLPIWQCGDDLNDTRDGRTYKTVQIGSQCWMAENLNIGTMIDAGSNQTNNSLIEKYCYDNDLGNCNTYGGLFQWNEMMQYITTQGAQGICQSGWHLPADEEWKQLEGEVDGLYGYPDPEWDESNWRGYDAGLNLKSVDGWYDSGNGLNLYGFAGLPGGYRRIYGDFSSITMTALYWSSSESTSSSALARYLDHGYESVYRRGRDRDRGFSVRCLQD